MGVTYTTTGINIDITSGQNVGTFVVRDPALSDPQGVQIMQKYDSPLYLGQVVVGGTTAGTPGRDGVLTVKGADNTSSYILDPTGGLLVNSGVNNYLELNGTNSGSGPSAPSGNGARLYLDTSGGKTRLMARFESGTAVAIAVEP